MAGEYFSRLIHHTLISFIIQGDVKNERCKKLSVRDHKEA